MPNLPSTIVELVPLLKGKVISPVEVTRECLARIERLNPSLNAFITVIPETALAEARVAENGIMRGEWRGPLHGVPVSLKDLIDVGGVRTTSASALHKDRVANEDAEVVTRLKQAGAVLLGKTNLHEFAYGGSSLVSYFGEIRNPRSLENIAGGSSGGSAAAVVAGLGYASIGTDTAGSVREPAALCGCVGLKPTYGRISKRGVFPLSDSLDHVGILARSVEDAAMALEAIAGYDAHDPDSIEVAVDGYLSDLEKNDVRKLRVGLPRDFFFADLDAEIAASVEDAIHVVGRLVAEVKDIRIEVPTDRTVQAVESYAVHAEDIKASPELYQTATLERLQSGASYSASDYIHARKVMERVRQEALGFFTDVDVLVTPTVAIPAPLIAELKRNPAALRPAELVLLRNTRPINVWGLPAVSVPCGFTKAGLPIGLQFVAAPWREDVILRMAHTYEQATDWHKRPCPA